jgi:hypothetical protein
VEAMPLTFYSIADGAVLVAVTNDFLQAKDWWIHLIFDQEAFEERMAVPKNPAVTLESARFRDLRMHRLTERPNAWTKLRACIEDIEDSR